jgi:ribonuclease P protein component
VPACPPNRGDLIEPAGSSPETPSTGGFTRSARLLSPAQFKRVFSRACKVGGRYLTVLARANDIGHPRLGLAISRKHVKRAVGRNLIKRQIRESFRLHQAIIGGFDVVVLGKPGVDKLDRREIRALIDACWQELAIRCKKS